MSPLRSSDQLLTKSGIEPGFPPPRFRAPSLGWCILGTLCLEGADTASASSLTEDCSVTKLAAPLAGLSANDPGPLGPGRPGAVLTGMRSVWRD